MAKTRYRGNGMRVLLLAVLILLLDIPATASASYWIKSFGGSSWDKAHAVAIADNGDIIVAGDTKSFGAGGDVWVLRLDPNGNIKWQKIFGGVWNDSVFDVAIADNGDIIVAGGTNSFGDGLGDVWVLRLDSNGNIKWQKTFGGSSWDEAYAVAIADNGDIIVAGGTNSFGAGGYDVWVLRLDSNGNIKWQKTFGGVRYDWVFDVAIADNGDIIIAGYTGSFSDGLDDDVWVLRLDSNGNIKWQKTFGRIRWDGAYTVAIADNGDIIVAGYTVLLSTGYDDVWVLRLDPNGNIKWQKTFGGYYDDWTWAVAIADNGDIIIAGDTKSFGAGGNAWVLRLDSNGNIKWQKTFGGSSWDEAYAVAIADNGDIIVAGDTKSFGAGDYDVWVMKLPLNGELPNCTICKDTDAKVTDTNATVRDTDAIVEDTNAIVKDTRAVISDTNAKVFKQYGAITSTAQTPKITTPVTSTTVIPTKATVQPTTTETVISTKTLEKKGIPGFGVVSAIVAITYITLRKRK